MVEIDEAMRRALLAREGPPPGVRELVLAGVRRRVGDGGGSDDPGESEFDADALDMPAPSSAPASTTMWWAKLVAATVTMTSAGLVVLRLAVVGARALQGEAGEPSEPQQVEAGEPSEPQPGPQLGSPATTQQSMATSPELPPAPRRGRADLAAPTPTPIPTTSPDASLAEELALVAKAKRLRATAPSEALAELEHHRERFPAGALAPEREVLRIEIGCALGRVEQAEQLRERFVVEHADSPLLARVRGACRDRGTEAEPSGDESSR